MLSGTKRDFEETHDIRTCCLGLKSEIIAGAGAAIIASIITQDRNSRIDRMITLMALHVRNFGFIWNIPRLVLRYEYGIALLLCILVSGTTTCL